MSPSEKVENDLPEPSVPAAWRLRLRPLAKVYAAAGWLLPILTVIADEVFGYWHREMLLLALGCALVALPLGLIARQGFATGTGILAGGLLLVLIPEVFRLPRHNFNESGAVANLMTINTAQKTYLSINGTYGGVEDLVVKAGLLDSRFSTGTVSGYKFTVTAKGDDYTAAANPANKNAGRFSYFIGPDGVVRYGTMAPQPDQVGQPVR